MKSKYFHISLVCLIITYAIILVSCSKTNPTSSSNTYGPNNGKITFNTLIPNGGISITVDNKQLSLILTDSSHTCDMLVGNASTIIQAGTYTANITGHGISCTKNNITVKEGQCLLVNIDDCMTKGETTMYTQNSSYLPIVVTVDGNPFGTITSVYNSSPHCDTIGTAFGSLTGGNHHCHATCAGHYWDFNFDVTIGFCDVWGLL